VTYDDAKRYLLARAEERGVELEVLATETRELTVEAFDGDLTQIVDASQGGVGLRVVVGGRTGYASSEERDEAALDWALDEAIENAELQADSDGFLPQGQALGRHDLLGEGLSAPLAEKAERALELERLLRADERVLQVPATRYIERELTGVLGSTAGADGGYRNGISGLLTTMVMQQGESLKQGSKLAFEKEFHALDPGRTAIEALERTGRLLGAKALETGRYRAYLEPAVVAQLLGLITFALSGRSLIENKTPFAERLGERVASETITLRDDPTHPDGLASRPFDSEGAPAREATLIEGGVLRSFLHNSRTAARSGQPNTGHARRGYKGTLGVGPSNLILDPGAGVTMDTGILVVRLMGLHAGANPISGDFSLQALGLRVDGGEVGEPVENFAMSGNLYEMLHDVVAVGDTLEWTFTGASTATPLIEVGELSFGGG
jgi:PmbA protein